MERSAEILANKLEKFEGKELDIFPISKLFALDVVCGKK
jgi:hypothetical protein